MTDLVDFALIERCTPRLTVGAAHVRTSEMRYFDSREIAITARHVMASGALPPAFPAVRIDGELFWDGGILSNTPTEAIFEDSPRRNSLIFAVHMWNPMGPGSYQDRIFWSDWSDWSDLSGHYLQTVGKMAAAARTAAASAIATFLTGKSSPKSAGGTVLKC